MFDSTMKTEPIPERVYSLCRALLKGPVNENELKKAIEPDSLNEKGSYFSIVKSAAEQLRLIESNADDNTLMLAVDKHDVDTIKSMRLYVNSILETCSDGQFYKTTHTWMTHSDELLNVSKDYQSVSKIISFLNSYDNSLRLAESNMLGWRFWATFLGFGYLQEMFFLPNPAVFLYDCIINSQIEKKKEYTVSEFIQNLRPYIDICIGDEIEERRLNFAVSNAFRTLHDLGIITLKFVNDRQDEWNMYDMPLHTFSSQITDVVFNGGKL